VGAILVDLFVAAALGMVVVGSTGAAYSRGPLARLHFLGPLSLLAPPLLAAAWTCQGGSFADTAKCWLTALVLILQAPILTHVAAHAHWRRRHPEPRTSPEELGP